MQKRKIAAGLVAVGAVFGAYISGLLPKFGGSGTGNGTGDGTVAAVTADGKKAAAPVADATQANATKPATTKADPSKATSDQPVVNGRTTTLKTPPKMPVLDVYVKGHSYQIKDPSGSGENVFIKMDDILKIAKLTTGNEDGVRVRILRYRSAKYVAWAQLAEELSHVGIGDDALRIPKDLLEDPKPQPKVQAKANEGSGAQASATKEKPAGQTKSTVDNVRADAAR